MYLLRLLVLLCCFSGALCQERPVTENLPATTQAEAILARARRAKGAADRVQAFTVVTHVADLIEGRLWQMQMTRHFTTSSQMRADTLYPESGKRRNAGLSGDQGWSEEDGKATTDSADLVERKKWILRNEWWVNFFRVLPGQDYKLQALDEVMLEKQPQEVLLVQFGAFKLTVYFAQATHLLTKVDYDFVIAERTYHFEEWYRDYRWVQGVRLAHRISTYVDGRLQAQPVVLRYRLNQPLAADRYAHP